MIKQIERSPQSAAENTITGEGFRITLLTSRLIRMEFQKENHFCDEATQTVLNRDFPAVPFRREETVSALVLRTNALTILCEKRLLAQGQLQKGISVQMQLLPEKPVWHYGDMPENLKGTARTLDEADGAIALEPGLAARCGYSVLDDSRSLLLTEAFLKPRPEGQTDLYLFAYGCEYQACLRDFYRLCGSVPMLPRYALGNWWSRYHKYTEKTYEELIQRFEAEKVPITVAVIDMDWHVTELEEKYGSGWTGYTWNRELFPDPPRFLAWLHEHGLHTTLNLHPALGIRACEAMYPDVARAMGIDPASEKTVACDMADPHFIEVYFDKVLHPYEKQGVDFWWIDWQQGTKTKMKDLDPLWVLNHYHYLDSRKDHQRGMTFSRYAGAGSHRYPIGFSGDSHATWDSLRFQPYFTATASNVGYGWWSHDICGHMHGSRDCELMIRWAQFGVFSPIMRLHTSANPFFVKEPWKLPIEYREVMDDFLRLRHRMIPYLYTMNWRAHREGIPLVRPLYYVHPEEPMAYQCPNQYYFGDALMICPVTSRRNTVTHLAAERAWLPAGRWMNLFTGRIYDSTGGIYDTGKTMLYSALSEMPALLRAGGILVMSGENGGNRFDNPRDMDVFVGTGADGSFQLYEDDGITEHSDEEASVCTEIRYRDREGCLHIGPACGDCTLIPAKRNWSLHFIGCARPKAMRVLDAQGESIPYRTRYDSDKCEWTVTVGAQPSEKEFAVHFQPLENGCNDILYEAFHILEWADEPYDNKQRAWQKICEVCGVEEKTEEPHEKSLNRRRRMEKAWRASLPEMEAAFMLGGLSEATREVLLNL
jgi:hypothetical protein